MSDTLKAEKAIKLIIHEYNRALTLHGPFNSAHEGYAIILEELDELWNEVKKKAVDRSVDKMIEEAVEVGATALRFLVDVCMKEVKTE